MRDSLGRCDPNAYNAVHWNGQKWELKRIYYYSSCNPVDYPPFKSIIAFSDTEIVLTSGGSIGWFNGRTNRTDCGIRSLLTGAINKLWGSSSSDLYAVGNNGNIAHWDGVEWRKIESGTDLPIKDVYGGQDKDSGKYQIICVAEKISPGGSKVLSIENRTVREITTNGLLSWGVWSIWFIPKRLYITAGDGLWYTRSLSGTWIRNNKLPALFKESVRGQALNDIVVCGDFFLLAHYNGISWQTFFPRNSGAFGSIDIKGNLVVTVGFSGNQALVIRGSL